MYALCGNEPTGKRAQNHTGDYFAVAQVPGTCNKVASEKMYEGICLVRSEFVVVVLLLLSPSSSSTSPLRFWILGFPLSGTGSGLLLVSQLAARIT